MINGQIVSELDVNNLLLLRNHVSELFISAAEIINCSPQSNVLDIAPQDHGGVRKYLNPEINLKTFDIDPKSGADFIGDICSTNDNIPDGAFDFIVCTEVLEHVSNPFEAIKEIERILSPGGIAFFSAPFNFRIHGPLPDNWRFSEHGWRELLKSFSKVEIEALETADRYLMPLHYNLVAYR